MCVNVERAEGAFLGRRGCWRRHSRTLRSDDGGAGRTATRLPLRGGGAQSASPKSVQLGLAPVVEEKSDLQLQSPCVSRLFPLLGGNASRQSTRQVYQNGQKSLGSVPYHFSLIRAICLL